MIRVLNLYAGIGGNRKTWDPPGCNITAVERQHDIAAVYRKLYPRDLVLECDAHEFLRERYAEFDFIWTSPPCQSHSKMDRANPRNRPRFADMRLYEEIVFLRTYHKGLWVVENVAPYYEPLIQPTQRIGRHLFWSNFHFLANDVPRPERFIASGNQASAESLKSWLGIQFPGNLYYDKNHCPAQVLRNAVHPEIGRQIFAAAMQQLKNLQPA